MMDFIIIDFDVDPKVLFILGCPFLATMHSMIDVFVGQLTMHAYDKVEVFNL